MARTYAPRLADPAALWNDLARMYRSQALHQRNLDKPEKAAAYDKRAAEATAKAQTYLKPC